MKQIYSLLTVIAALTAMGSVSADKLHKPELNPMILVELQASMKADLILAERHMTFEIRDELEAQSSSIIIDGISAKTTMSYKINSNTATKWSVAAGE